MNELRMIDVGGKAPTYRRAVARGTLRMGRMARDRMRARMDPDRLVDALVRMWEATRRTRPA